MPHAKVTGRQRKTAKALRQRMTKAEALLWRYLKAHHVDGLGFRRQVPLGSYVADFVCHSARLVVELDGESHDFEERCLHDQARDDWFAAQEFRVLRFTNADVLSNLNGVVSFIRQAAADAEGVAPPSLSLPHKGGGNAVAPAEQTAEREASGAGAGPALARPPSLTLPRERGRGRVGASGNVSAGRSGGARS